MIYKKDLFDYFGWLFSDIKRIIIFSIILVVYFTDIKQPKKRKRNLSRVLIGTT